MPLLFVDATMLNCWARCREEFRDRYIEGGNGIAPLKPALPLITGSAFHRGVETFWRGGSYQEAMAVAMAEMDIDESLLSMPEREKLQEAREYLPDMLACYFDNQSYEPSRLWRYIEEQTHEDCLAVEWEWYLPWNDVPPPFTEVLLVGKMDRVEVVNPVRGQPHIFDCKTASEIGKNWKHDYRAGLLRDIQFQLYDFYLTSIGHSPTMSTVEVITKPYKSKPSRLVLFDLPELAAYRERFKQQLDWMLREMVHYCSKYREAKPWPMAAATTCIGKYGPCDFLRICNEGASAKVMGNYGPRVEHLTNISKRITP